MTLRRTRKRRFQGGARRVLRSPGATRAFAAAPLVLSLSCDDSCTAPADQSPEDSPWTVELQRVFGPVDARFLESHECPPGGCEPVPTLRLQTELSYPSTPASLVYRLNRSAGDLSLLLAGVSVGPFLMTGRAEADIPLPLTRGDCTLSVSWDTTSAEIEITLSDESILLRRSGAGELRLADTLVWRHPRGSFACRGGATAVHAWLCDAFLDSLRAALPIVEFEFDTVGTVPFPAATTSHEVNMPVRYFRYAGEAQFDSAGAVLAAFSRQLLIDRGDCELQLVNWMDRRFESSAALDALRADLGEGLELLPLQLAPQAHAVRGFAGGDPPEPAWELGLLLAAPAGLDAVDGGERVAAAAARLLERPLHEGVAGGRLQVVVDALPLERQAALFRALDRPAGLAVALRLRWTPGSAR